MSTIKPKSFTRRICTSLVTGFLTSFLPLIARAQLQGDIINNLTAAGRESKLGTKSLPETVGGIINAGLAVIGTLFLGLIVYAGFVWLLARGREDEIGRAQKIIETSIIGLIVLISAYAISKFVFAVIIAGAGIN